jgi:diguanylate cyclase (GGDEF)-like protein
MREFRLPLSEKQKIQQILKHQKLQAQEILMYQNILEGIRRGLKFNSFLKLIVNSVRKGLGFKRAGVFLVEPDGKNVRLVIGIDKKCRFESNKERVPINIPRGVSYFADVINGHKKFFFSNDIPHRIAKKDAFRVPVYNNALVPLQFGGEKAIGAIAVDNLDENRPITKSDVVSLMNYATQVGLAIESFRTHEKMVSLSFTDAMTGLYNRRFFDKALSQELSRCQRYSRHCSLLLIDIDHFKRVNDTYGHDSGDEIIQQVASILQNNIRGLDVVARVGGEEFAIILPETEPQNVAVVVNRLLKAFRHAKPRVKIMAVKKEVVTISIGVASYRGGDISAAGLLKLADKSLYSAKRTGRDKAGPHYDSKGKIQQKAHR